MDTTNVIESAWRFLKYRLMDGVVNNRLTTLISLILKQLLLHFRQKELCGGSTRSENRNRWLRSQVRTDVEEACDQKICT